METLAHVRDLTLRLISFTEGNLDWLVAYGQLTGLTRLSLNISDGLRCYLPECLTEIEHLVDVQVTAGYKEFFREGKAYVISLLGSLPLLSRLQIDIEPPYMAHSVFPVWTVKLRKCMIKLSRGRWGLGSVSKKRVRRIGRRVCLKTHKVAFAVEMVNELFVDCCAVFTREE